VCFFGYLSIEEAHLMLVRWLVLIHALAALTYFLLHGTSLAMAFCVRKETDFARIRAMLDLSAATVLPMGIAFGIMGLTGLVMPFLIQIWDKVYIWLSIVLILFVFICMGEFNETRYKELRRLVGLPYMKGNKTLPADLPSTPEEVAALLQKTNVTALATVGYIIPALVLWLMIFKPF
jgi:hypothetical protein